MSIYESQLHDRWGRPAEPRELKHIPVGQDWKGNTIYLDDGKDYMCYFPGEYVDVTELSDYLIYIYKTDEGAAVDLMAEAVANGQLLTAMDLYEEAE
ncbi:MAG: hypothetical protein F6I01_002275 [Aerococcus sanguinicola]|uniref:hypothetical protein n=1 Tax=Aerococcus sp. HMSC062A02 TaxID=1715105 RepID=UPI0008A5005B|nr:hypothetical protein [Aerococcus sp. HMSC062A02]OFN02607.1 hypothetical protein HMPREF2626_01455 [Aerococcus sp. HMSC062A02]